MSEVGMGRAICLSRAYAFLQVVMATAKGRNKTRMVGHNKTPTLIKSSAMTRAIRSSKRSICLID